MAATYRFTGAGLSLWWDVIDDTHKISGDFRTLTINESQNSADLTAGGDTIMVYGETQADVSISLQFMDQNANSFAGTALYPGVAGTLYAAPAGTADGRAAYALHVFVEQDNLNIPFNEGVTRELTLRPKDQWLAHYRRLGSTWNSGTILTP